MKQQTMYISIVAIVIIIGVGWYIYDQGTFEETNTEGNIETEFGGLQTQVICETSDGRTYDLTGNVKDSLTITNPDGVEVTSMTINLNAKFAEVPGYDCYENIEFEMAPETNPVGTPPSDSLFEDTNVYSDIVKNFVSDNWHAMHETYAPTTGVFSQGDPCGQATDYFLTVFSHDIPLENVFSGDNTLESGSYMVSWNYQGYCAWRGGSDINGWTDWTFVDFRDISSLDGTVDITYTGSEVTITFESNIVWT